MIQGLLRVTREKEIEVLVTEIDGLKFKLTDGLMLHMMVLFISPTLHQNTQSRILS
ncbi:hypothetical protein MtrunA17_Chr1g0187561 [Medicago truncatula]|uniref:Uncharacterized protein n=1 Tax=Medicago truncatula TaxID=3880 RepID=A0A396JQ21_MEDTR|nr:hypothetical protein MtrunA17_Chr1g0187561 [Medicago truncatula]